MLARISDDIENLANKNQRQLLLPRRAKLVYEGNVIIIWLINPEVNHIYKVIIWLTWNIDLIKKLWYINNNIGRLEGGKVYGIEFSSFILGTV